MSESKAHVYTAQTNLGSTQVKTNPGYVYFLRFIVNGGRGGVKINGRVEQNIKEKKRDENRIILLKTIY